jgi:DNA replication and repair protein RecF
MREIYDKVVLFSPIIMNMMYLSPSLRREFLDEILLKTFPDYKKILIDYKKILTSRNKILKNIREKKSDISELEFWDNKFINLSTIIYNYRF